MAPALERIVKPPLPHEIALRRAKKASGNVIAEPRLTKQDRKKAEREAIRAKRARKPLVIRLRPEKS